MHGGDALERQIVVHHAEHALLHLTAVPGVYDDLLAAGDVEDDGRLGIEAELLVVFDLGLGCVVDNEVGLEVLKLFLCRTDEHVRYEVRLPCDLHDEADGHARVFIGTAESVDNVQLFAAQLVYRDLFNGLPCLLSGGVVIVFVFVAGPPYGVLAVFVDNDEFILGGAAGVNAGHDVHSVKLGEHALVKALKAGLHFVFKKLLVRGVADDLRSAGDTVSAQINTHFNNLAYKKFAAKYTEYPAYCYDVIIYLLILKVNNYINTKTQNDAGIHKKRQRKRRCRACHFIRYSYRSSASSATYTAPSDSSSPGSA